MPIAAPSLPQHLPHLRCFVFLNNWLISHLLCLASTQTLYLFVVTAQGLTSLMYWLWEAKTLHTPMVPLHLTFIVMIHIQTTHQKCSSLLQDKAKFDLIPIFTLAARSASVYSVLGVALLRKTGIPRSQLCFNCSFLHKESLWVMMCTLTSLVSKESRELKKENARMKHTPISFVLEMSGMLWLDK